MVEFLWTRTTGPSSIFLETGLAWNSNLSSSVDRSRLSAADSWNSWGSVRGLDATFLTPVLGLVKILSFTGWALNCFLGEKKEYCVLDYTLGCRNWLKSTITVWPQYLKQMKTVILRFICLHIFNPCQVPLLFCKSVIFCYSVNQLFHERLVEWQHINMTSVLFSLAHGMCTCSIKANKIGSCIVSPFFDNYTYLYTSCVSLDTTYLDKVFYNWMAPKNLIVFTVLL